MSPPGPHVRPAGPAPDAPVELAGYRLVELLGRGGMGEVWRAERAGPGGIKRRAAVKRILPRLQSDPQLRERFLAEARTNARLEHPNIVQVLDFGDQPEPFLVLEFVEGITAADLLREVTRAKTRLPVVAAAFIAAEAAAGLDYAHRRRGDDGRPLGIVHRDVSPQNVLVSAEGAVKVADFGVARAADNTFRTREGLSVGKLVYMAPEQAAGQPFDARADVFALGVTLWELLTATPFLSRDDPNAALNALLKGAFRTPCQVDPRLPATVDALVMPALARDPAERYASAGAFAQAIRTFIHSLAPGFDSTELARIVRKLAPPAAAPAAAASVPGARDVSLPLAAPIAAPPQAPREMPAFAPPGGFGAAPAPAFAPVARPAPSATASPDPAQLQRAATRITATARVSNEPPPVPPVRGGRTGLVVGAVAVFACALGVGGGAVLWLARRDRAPAPPAVVVPAPSAPGAAPSTSITALSTWRAPDGTGVAPPPSPSPAVAPVVAPQALPTPPPESHRGSSGTRGEGASASSAAAALGRALAPLRGLVRACLGAREGSGERYVLTVTYDGTADRVSSIEASGGGNALEAQQQQCLLSTFDGAVHLHGVNGTVSTQRTYEF